MYNFQLGKTKFPGNCLFSDFTSTFSMTMSIFLIITNLKIIKDSKTEDKLVNFEGLSVQMLAELARNNIITLNDFADLSSYELIDENDGILKNFDIDQKTADKMIMRAREDWFKDEQISDTKNTSSDV